MGSAVLSVWDDAAGVAHDLPVEWKTSPTKDAQIKVPKSYEAQWKLALETFRRDHSDGSPIAPYSTLDLWVPIKDINKNAHGFFAIAVEVWGRRQVGWRESPPMPKQEPASKDVEQ